MLNKCNSRIKQTIQIHSKRVLNPEYVCSLKYITGQTDKGIEHPILIQIYQVGPHLKSGIKGSQGKIDTGTRSKAAFFQPAKKAPNQAILSLGSQRLGSQHEASDQQSQMEIYSSQANVFCIQIDFSWSNTNLCIVIMLIYSQCATMLCYSTQS